MTNADVRVDSDFSATSNLPNILAALFVLIYSVAFLTLKFETQGINRFHLLFIGAIFISYFLLPLSRKLILIACPMAFYGMMYDFFQYIPFTSLMPIRVTEPYYIDLHLFGVFSSGKLIPLHEYIYQILNSPAFDLYCGFIYMLHIPVIILLLLSFWRFGSDELAAKFIFAFWVMNVFAFATYFFYPAAAPWFVSKYGFMQPFVAMPGDPAGLARFDQILGLNLFTQNYQISPVPFGAIPSMHAGFSMLGFLYSFQLSKKLSVLLGFYCLSMWFAALYLQHHYLIDVILGVIYALIAYGLVEKFLKRGFLKVFRYLKTQLVDQASFTLFHPKKQ